MKRWAGVAVLVVLSLAACGEEGDGGESGSEEPAATVEKQPAENPKPKKQGPLDCLAEAGLEKTEQRGATTWRGFDGVDGTIVLVEKYGSSGEAAGAVADATAVHAEKGGTYAVTGALKSANDGANVRAVAACLDG